MNETSLRGVAYAVNTHKILGVPLLEAGKATFIPVVLCVAFAMASELVLAGEPALYGDGIHDDAVAIQSMIDTGASVVELPPPKKSYLIRTTLRLGDGQELRLGRFTYVRLADGANCSMLENRDFTNGNRRVAVTGGIWDMNNLGQRHNLAAAGWMDKVRRRGWLNEKRENVQVTWPRHTDGQHHSDYFLGVCMRFYNVKDFVLKDVTIVNPTVYGIQLWKVRGFLVDNVVFDYRWGNPAKANMDGLHLDGFCRNGKISNLRGCCFDDFVALNATDGTDSPGHGPIEDIDIDGIYCDYCHSAVRLLSRSHADAIRRISIRNVHGRYYSYGIGLTYFYRKVAERGLMDQIAISDCHLSGAFEPADLWQLGHLGLVEIEAGVDIGGLHIERLSRDEDVRPEVDTILLHEGATVDRLTIRDCEQVNRTKDSMTFLHNRGRIGTLVHENTRLVSSPGANVIADDVTPAARWAQRWVTLADLKSCGIAYPERGATLPDSSVVAGFGENMIRIYPFTGTDSNAFAGEIDEYGLYAIPGVCWCEYKNFPIRMEVTATRTTAWFRIRFPETEARNILVDSRFSVTFSEHIAGKNGLEGNTIYRFAPGDRPIVVKVSKTRMVDEDFDFDRAAGLARREWSEVCRPSGLKR